MKKTYNNASVLECTPKIKIKIDQEIQNKITKLCSVISTVEWSGILLYALEDEEKMSISDPENLTFVIKDIILMDKGTQTFTSYNFSEKKRNQEGYSDAHIEYCELNMEALTWTIGHIHSHNNMGVFFSGTDMEELFDNSPSHNYYLSLIVNNRNEMVAKVCIYSEARSSCEAEYTGLDKFGKPYTLQKVTLNTINKKYFIYDCEIEKPEQIVVENEDFFSKRLIEVLSKSEPVINRKSIYDDSVLIDSNKTSNKSFTWSHYEKKEKEDIVLDIQTAKHLEDFALRYVFKSYGSNKFSNMESFVSVLVRQSLKNFVPTILKDYYKNFKLAYKEDKNDFNFYKDLTEHFIVFLRKYSGDINAFIPLNYQLKQLIQSQEKLFK